ncbi:MAG: MarR family winged helix-turn-helix transcriptional regulator [Beijerinckiaceae bacterium]
MRANLVKPADKLTIVAPPGVGSLLPDFALIELIFFGYRDFVGEPDRVLERYGFGRAHHRILHFVHRQPGLTIASLLDILRITKQSLARVLKDLMDHGYVEQRSGADDKRQRLLFLTPKGTALAIELAEGQSKRIGVALAEAGPQERIVIERFLMGLIDPSTRPEIRQRLGSSKP